MPLLSRKAERRADGLTLGLAGLALASAGTVVAGEVLRLARRRSRAVGSPEGVLDTAEQAALFRLCPGEPIGVRLNEACFMTPGKSISWLVGIGPEARVDHYFTQCRRCWMRDCAYRRGPAATTVREPGDGVW